MRRGEYCEHILNPIKVVVTPMPFPNAENTIPKIIGTVLSVTPPEKR
jgi:hypothetical protein